MAAVFVAAIVVWRERSLLLIGGAVVVLVAGAARVALDPPQARSRT